MVNVTIIGTGDHAYGLAHLYKINNTASTGNYLVVTKPGLAQDTSGPFHDTGIEYAGFDESLRMADIVILAIPASGIKGFVKKYGSRLSDKVVVDCTNSNKKAGSQDLFSALAHQVEKSNNKKKYEFSWVKGLNDFGAVDVLLKKANSKVKLTTKMCSPDDRALRKVKKFAEESLGCVVKKIPIEQYVVLSQHQNSIGKEWVRSTWLMILTFVVTQIYNILR